MLWWCVTLCVCSEVLRNRNIIVTCTCILACFVCVCEHALFLGVYANRQKGRMDVPPPLSPYPHAQLCAGTKPPAASFRSLPPPRQYALNTYIFTGIQCAHNPHIPPAPSALSGVKLCLGFLPPPYIHYRAACAEPDPCACIQVNLHLARGDGEKYNLPLDAR
jgi:hypothetical protein